MKYSLVVAQASGGAVVGNYTLRANSIYDVDFTGAGHSPTGYSELIGSAASGAATQPYRSWVVRGLEYHISGVSSDYCVYAIGVTNASSAWSSTSIDRIMSQYGVSWHQRGPQAPTPCRFTGYIDIAKAFGVDPAKLRNDDTYSGTYNTNPTNVLFLQLAHQDSDLSSVETTHWAIELVFDVELYELNTLQTF
jgi:hypothetical protein